MHDLPWAQQAVLETYAGLFDWEIERQLRPACLTAGWVERGDVRVASGRAPARLGLTPTGAALLERPWSLALQAEALWRVAALDVARRVLAMCARVGDAGHHGRLAWALTPYTVPVQALRSETPYMGPKAPFDPERGLSALRLDALAAIEWPTDRGPRWVAIAVWVDPGDIRLTRFSQQCRALRAWRRRSEFAREPERFPIVLVVAAHKGRRTDMIRLWRESARHAEPEIALLWVTLSDLASGGPASGGPACGGEHLDWQDSVGTRVPLWARVRGARNPLAAPRTHVGAWWGTELAPLIVPPLRLRRGVVARARVEASNPTLRLTALQLALSARERALCAAVGNYPLLTARDHARVSGLDDSHTRAALRRLQALGLILRDDSGQHWLSWDGVAWSAAQAGLSPEAYARLRRWPVERPNGKPRLSVQGLVDQADHTRAVIDVLVGVKRALGSGELQLATWDHVTPLQGFVGSPEDRRRAGVQARIEGARVIPDAVAALVRRERSGKAMIVTRFWLELDRGTIRGARLMRKLKRYYSAGGPGRGWFGRPERILVIVREGGEGRLRLWQRRVRALDAAYHTRLDIRLTRWDLVANADGGVHLLRAVWRSQRAGPMEAPFPEEVEP
ncbi:MAG: replication-relaxation family protein [Anaerolineales bacterium]|nr:replication-relaxation family protein [Anaerolineales bacterium]